MPRTVRILHVDDCPNVAPTIARVREVASDLRIDVLIESIQLTDASEARALGFLGSPTVQVDGRDVDPEAGPAGDANGLGCRLYGRSGVPPRELIERALAPRAER